MKVAFRLPLIAVVSLIAVCSAGADEFDDYRIPAHDLIDWRLQLQTDATRLDQGSASVDVRSRSVRAGAGTAFSWLSDSDPMRTEFLVAASGSALGYWSHLDAASIFIPGGRSDDHEIRAADESWNVSFHHRRFPFDIPIGGSLRVSASGTYRQEWVDDRSETTGLIDTFTVRDVERRTRETWDYFTRVSTELMIGVGRVRDASSIYEARVLEDRLLQTGALARPLSAGARQKLASLLATRLAYEVLRERPAKSLWQKIEVILREDGGVSDRGLDAYSVLRAGEPHTRSGLLPDDVPRSPVLRQVGFFAGPALLDLHTNQIQRFDVSIYLQRTLEDSAFSPSTGTFASRSEFNLDETFVGVRGEYHRPLGLRWQADLSGEVFFPTQSKMEGNTGSAAGRMSWMLADRWDASAFARYDRLFLKDSDDVDEDRWVWEYGVTGTWYIEDRLQLTLVAVEQQQDRPTSFGVGGGASSSLRNGRVSITLTYRILGGFGAPGLIPREAL